MKRYSIACLAGNGTSPELMAEASLTLTRVSRLHGFALDEVHASFGADAISRLGVSLPPATRVAVLDADAVLVSAPRDPWLAEVQADLDVRARMTYVRSGSGCELMIVTPVDADGAEWAVSRAFAAARERTLRVCAVEDGDDWEAAVEAAAARHDDVAVERLRARVALPAIAFDRRRFDVVVASAVYADALVELAGAAAGRRLAAHALVGEHGPGLFFPAEDGGAFLAGQGVVDPSSMLLAAALLLGEGLGERGAQATLTGAVGSSVSDLPDAVASIGRTTRETTESVLQGFHLSLRNAEFWTEAAR